jgi:thioredoxin-dependent peroxiredoxin
MSKKTRKKSPKPAAGKTIRARPARTAKAPSKARKATAARSGESAKKKQPGNPTAKASHKAPSKKLKSSSPQKSASPTIAAPKATATKPVVGTAPVKKLPGDKGGGSPAPRSTPSARVSVPLAEGAKAPAFSLPRDGGSTVSLKDYAGQKLVLFFYPRADTPGCTKEAIDFTRLTSAFADTRTAVIGVSADPLKAQEAFRNKHQLSTPLVSDERHEMLEAYGVWGEKSMYGRTFQGILRTTVLIGGDGRVISIWRHVKVDGHADEVLAAARAG